MIDIERDLRIANEASPGKWEKCSASEGNCPCGAIWSMEDRLIVLESSSERWLDHEGYSHEQMCRNANFAAHFDPVYVKELLSTIQSLQRKADD